MNGLPFSLLAMHLPDGFLNLSVSLVGLLSAGLMLGVAARQVRQQGGRYRAALVGALAALIFAGQMLNFPIIGGTSGHLVGAVLAAVLLGPAAAFLTLTSVLVVQALVFHDGGILALGFNIINMGLIGAYGGFAIYRWLLNRLGDGAQFRWVSAGAAAWLSVVLAAAAVALELAASGTVPLTTALASMVGVHLLIGVGEAVITVGVLIALDRAKASAPARWAQGSALRWVGVALVAAAAITLVAPLASAHPDGLERVALDHGFADRAVSLFVPFLSDYALPFVNDPVLATMGAGILGVFVIGVMALGLAYGAERSRALGSAA